MKKVLYRVTMPGGALGATFHIPLVTHEIGHVLMFKLERDGLDDSLADLYDESAEDEVYQSWVKEIVADAICGFVAGPAAFFALYESLRGLATSQMTSIRTTTFASVPWTRTLESDLLMHFETQVGQIGPLGRTRTC